MSILIEDTLPNIRQDGFNTNKNAAFGGTVAITGVASLIAALNQTGLVGFNAFNVANLEGHVASAIPATATATAAQTATGYITSTSAAATTITLPTGTLLGAALGATAGDVFDLIVDNTAGANTVTIAVATNGIKSDAANTTAASFGQLTVASGATGIGRFTLMFSSATAYVFTRTA